MNSTTVVEGSSGVNILVTVCIVIRNDKDVSLF